MDDIKKLAKMFLYFSGYYHTLRLWDKLTYRGAKLVVLAYHNISDGKEYLDGADHPFQIRPVLTGQVFETHLRILSRSYKVVSLDEGVRKLKSGNAGNMVAITFDDGYRSFFKIAFPLLRKYDVPATVFLPTDFIGAEKVFWWDKLNQIFFYLYKESAGPSDLAPIISKNLAADYSSSRNSLRRKIFFLWAVENSFRGMRDEQREEKIGRLRDLLSEDGRRKLRAEKTLNWEEINYMCKHKVFFGSHTCSHLTFRYATQGQIEEEIKESKQEIETRLGTKIISFAYPYGWDMESYQKAKPILKASGLSIARSSIPGFNDQNSDPYMLSAGNICLSGREALLRRQMILNFLEQTGRND